MLATKRNKSMKLPAGTDFDAVHLPFLDNGRSRVLAEQSTDRESPYYYSFRRDLTDDPNPPSPIPGFGIDYLVTGFIIPAYIAIWIDRQGIVTWGYRIFGHPGAGSNDSPAQMV